MKRGVFSLRRLRWKLTLSYTLVTVVALLALELLLASGLVAFLNSELLPRLIVQQFRDEIAPRLEESLGQTPPDAEDLREELTLNVQVAGARGADNPRPQEPPGLDLSVTPDDGSFFIVDDERRLLVAVPRLEEYPEGESFDAESVPGLAPLIDAAFEGEENAGRLSSNVDGRVLTVNPVEDNEGQVTGLLVGSFQLPNLTGPLLVTVGVSAVLLAIPAGVLGTVFGLFTAWGITRRLGRLAVAARAWSRGDFSVVTKDRSKDELGQLSRELNSMAVELENLLQTRGELATLEARNRFARDLHDAVKQQIFATSLQIAAARAMMRRDAEAAEDHLSQAEDLVHGAQRELNVLIHEMRPAALEGKGLVTALNDYATDWAKRSEIRATVRASGEREVPLEAEQALFRVAQEALANVARHSGARNVEVVLRYAPDNLTLAVSDDGRGFDTTRKPGEGYGLQSMRERLLNRGGHVNVQSAPGEGTTVTADCPIDRSGK